MKFNRYIIGAIGTAIIGIIILFYSEVYFGAEPSNLQQQPSSDPLDRSYDDYFLRGAANEETAGKQVGEETKKYICGTSLEKSTEYIREYQIPFPCSQPVGVTVDSKDNVWVAATWPGYLAVFNPQKQAFEDLIEIPGWKTKGTFGSMVWGMDFDALGNLWFTDQVNNAIWRYYVEDKKFEMYKSPTRGSYPSEIAFDPQGNVWFSEIFGKKLGVIDPNRAVHNTTEGITEYEMPADLEFETMGPVTMSKDNKTLWFTGVTFPEKGYLIGFDIDSKDFQVYDLPREAGVPVGIAEDNQGRLWINDHATNLFFMFDPETEALARYSTSLPTSRNSTTTLPYWNAFQDGKVWFNEHEGNAMAYFDAENRTLVEYQIPTRGEIWGNTTNPLKFALDSSGSAWFTEWSENKLGILDSQNAKDLPLWLSVSKDRIILDRANSSSDTVDLSVYSSIEDPKEKVIMTAASSISKSGRLWNISGTFSENEFFFDDSGSKKVSFTVVQSSEDLVPGNYTMTIGARYGTVTYSKVVDLIVK